MYQSRTPPEYFPVNRSRFTLNLYCLLPRAVRMLPCVPVENWSLTSLQQRLGKTRGRLVKHARYYWLFLGKGI